MALNYTRWQFNVDKKIIALNNFGKNDVHNLFLIFFFFEKNYSINKNKIKSLVKKKKKRKRKAWSNVHMNGTQLNSFHWHSAIKRLALSLVFLLSLVSLLALSLCLSLSPLKDRDILHGPILHTSLCLSLHLFLSLLVLPLLNLYDSEFWKQIKNSEQRKKEEPFIFRRKRWGFFIWDCFCVPVKCLFLELLLLHPPESYQSYPLMKGTPSFLVKTIWWFLEMGNPSISR